MTINEYRGMKFNEKEVFWKEKNVDGIVDENLYKKANPKILIIAQEPWAQNEEELLNYNLIDSMKKYGGNPVGNTAFAESAKLLRKIYNEEDEDILFRVAWINAKKQPTIGSPGNWYRIQRALGVNHDFLFKQIEDIDPEIIIAYNVFDGAKGLWNQWFKKRKKHLWYFKPNNTDVENAILDADLDVYVEEETKMLVVDVCHPCAREAFSKEVIADCVHCYCSGEYEIDEKWEGRHDRKAERRKNAKQSN